MAMQKRMADRIDWALWRSFLAVAEQGSLSAAARRLGLAQPTVGRHVEQIEEAVGRKLFLRSPQGLAPTDAALALLPEARAMGQVARSLERMASEPAGAAGGVVRIAASHVVGAEVLPEALAPLMDAHPLLEVELALSNDSADLLRHEADLAVRMVRPTQRSLVARRIGAVPIGFFAHRDYLARRGTPRSAGDLAGHVLIGADTDAAFLGAMAGLPGRLGRRSFRLRTDSEAAQLAAIRQAVGIGVCQWGIAMRDPRLVPVLPDEVRLVLDCWLATHGDLRAVRRIRLVQEHLARVLPGLFGRKPSGGDAAHKL